MKFITDDFLLNSKVAKQLYAYAKAMPIIDYHCHLSPKEIYEDKVFNNITELWLSGDHYKWRLMRSAGIEEKYITGDASDLDKFRMWAKTLSLAIGSPLYEWSHLELKNYFGYDEVLDESSYRQVWKVVNEQLKSLSARKLIKNSNVKVVCTTDDPIDDLKYHKLLAKEKLGFKVYPAWRPDKIVDIEKDTWRDYLTSLEKVSKMDIKSYEDLLKALRKRLNYFAKVNCTVADHGLANIPYYEYTDKEIDSIFKKAKKGTKLSSIETEKYKTSLLYELHKEYHKRGWVSQLHYGVKRNNNSHLFKTKGVDVGGDSNGDSGNLNDLADFLDLLDREDKLPKTIIYSLNSNDNVAIDTIMACFQRGPIKSKLQHGSAWWFNDNYNGMMEHLNSLAAQGYLAGFVGMLTDSRSFMSYARHEYFRRVLSNFIADLVNQGRFPNDEKKLKKIMENISYKNTKEYFGF